MDLRFEWDKAKAKANFRKHGVSFEFAKAVFKDPFAMEFLDDRQDYGEDRYLIVGVVDGVLLSVIFAEREQAIRLISARRATKNEEEAYFDTES